MNDPKTIAHDLRNLHRVKIHSMTAPGGRTVYSIHGTDETLRPLLDAADELERLAEWDQKTEWVQRDHDLGLLEASLPGMHRADAALAEIQRLRAQVKAQTDDAARIRAAAKQVQEIDLLNPYWCGAVQHLCDVLGVEL